MKVLQINVNGISGSTGKIVTDIRNVLISEGHECIIAYGANDRINGNGYVKICSEFERKINAAISRITGVKQGLLTPFSFNRVKKLIDKEKPDVVHVHCPNGFIIDIFKLLTYLARTKMKTILTNHAEFYYTGGCGHSFNCDKWKTRCFKCKVIKSRIPFFDASKYTWKKFKEVLGYFEKENLIVTSVSPWTKSRAEISPVQRNCSHEVVKNGINTDVFKVRKVSNDVKAKLPQGKSIALHVTAEFTTDKESIKGGYWIRELAYKLPNINFVVASTFTGVIENLPSNLYLWGRTKDQQELAELYNAADITLLTSKRETFSMIVAESLCCGTPVAGFKAGGPESIAIQEYCEFVPNGDLTELCLKIEQMLSNNKKSQTSLFNHKIKNEYSKENMSNRYIELYELIRNYKQ